MHNAMKLTIAAAAVLALAFVGWRFALSADLGGPAMGDPTPSSTSTPRAGSQPLREGSEGPGTFSTSPTGNNPVEGPPQITFDMPLGWAGIQTFLIASEPEDASAALLFVQPSGLYSDPCLANTGAPDVSVGSTATEFASALEAQTTYDARVTGETVIGGYNAISMELLTPSDLDYAACEDGQFWVWDAPLFSEGPNRWLLWIVDHGGAPSVVLADVTNATAEHRAQIEQIVRSIRIQS